MKQPEDTSADKNFQPGVTGSRKPPATAPSRFTLLLNEHEESVFLNGQTIARQGIYLLPNLFTTGALFAGFYSIVAAMQADFDSAAIAIFFALFCDGLDGRIARITHTESKFGAEYDSLADMVSFGVSPALMMFNWGLAGLGKLGWSAAFIFVACAALRLARFNTQDNAADKKYFKGLASPAAACIIASVIWVCSDTGWIGDNLPYGLSIFMAFLSVLLGFLMIANFPYYSFKKVSFRGRVPFVAIIVAVLVLGLATLDPPRIFLLAFLAYAASGPIMHVVNYHKREEN